jgi:putative oxidoreductase
MMRILDRLEEPIFGISRLVIGGLFACHGAQKLLGVLGGQRMTHIPKMLTAGIIEFFGGLLIAMGLAASIAAFIACGEMAVAYFTQHAPHNFWPIINRGELAVVYCFFFFYVIVHGAGRYSLDALIFRKKAA